MPLYEFQCQDCRSRTSILAKSVTDPVEPKCQACGGTRLVRVISRFAYHKSTRTIWEESGEPGTRQSPDFYKDPRNIGRWTEQKFRKMSITVPPEVKEKIEAARDGELPDELKK